MRVPDFANSSLPVEEREDGSFLNWLCGALEMYARRFVDAVELFDEFEKDRTAEQAATNSEIERVEGRRSVPIEEMSEFAAASTRLMKAHRWCEIAARDAVFSLYHFEHVIDAITTAAKNTCPTLRPHVYIDGLEAAAQEFDRLFPTVEILRNGLGHSAQNASNRAAARFNSVKLKDGNTIEAFEGHLTINGRLFSVTTAGRATSDGPAKGKIGILDVSRESADRVRAVQAKVYSALQEAVEFSASLPRPPKPRG